MVLKSEDVLEAKASRLPNQINNEVYHEWWVDTQDLYLCRVLLSTPRLSYSIRYS